MINDVKLAFNSGVELLDSQNGVSRAVVLDLEKKFELSWDRFIRLSHTAEAIKRYLPSGATILDVGGFDGALALFLPDFVVDVIDPITTGGNGFDLPTTYENVVAIDALEHIEPSRRDEFLAQLCRAGDKLCFINFPAQHSESAQELVFELTNNPLVREHVEWKLPDSVAVRTFLADRGYEVELQHYGSVALWVSQYLLQTFSPEVASIASRFLVEKHLAERSERWLYDLVIASKAKRT